jgi:predicted outer membrane protein
VNHETQLSDRLKAVTEAVAEGENDIEAARLALKKRELQVRDRIAALVSDVAKTVFASNSQALRQNAVRNLYWGLG